MSHVVEKNIPPTKVIAYKKSKYYTEIKESAQNLYVIAQEQAKDSLICLAEQSTFDQDIALKVCWPIKSTKIELTDDLEFIILPRVKVLSLTFDGHYNDLRSAFQTLTNYIRENQLKPQLTRRIIYHKKEEITGSFIFKKREYKYETEIQIPLLE